MLFNLANQYAINEMYTEALNTYQVIVKNKMFSNAGKSSCQRCACFHSCRVLQRSNICAAQNISLHHLFTSHCNNTISTAPNFNDKNNPTCLHLIIMIQLLLLLSLMSRTIQLACIQDSWFLGKHVYCGKVFTTIDTTVLFVKFHSPQHLY